MNKELVHAMHSMAHSHNAFTLKRADVVPLDIVLATTLEQKHTGCRNLD